MLNSQTLVSIIIICRNEKPYISMCIDAALAQTDSFIKAEVIVVDGMSDDGTFELIEQNYGNTITLLKNKQRYAPNGMNMGINYAKGLYIAICGARSIMSRNYLKDCITKIQENPLTPCVGGLIKHVGFDKTSNSIAAAMASSTVVGFLNFRTIQKSGFVDTVSVPVFTNKLPSIIGPFDETCIRNQDDDYSYRIYKAGYKIWMLTESFSEYYVRNSLLQLFKQYFQYGFWKIFVNKKNKTITSLRQLFPPAFLLLLICSILANIYITLIIVLVYLLFVTVTSAILGLRKKCSLPTLIIATINIHIAYGMGYLFGIFQLLVLKNKVPIFLTTSTR